MKSLLFGSFLLFMMFLVSCEWLFPTDEDTCDYVVCYSGPFYSDLDIRVTINSENRFVPIEVYLGNIEEEELLFTAEITKEWTSFSLEAGMYYSVMAFYAEGEDTIVAINGKTLFAPSDECGCDYDGAHTNLDVRLGD